MEEKDGDELVLLNMSIPKHVRDDFKVVAKLRRQTMTGLLFGQIRQMILEEQIRHPDAFPGYSPAPRIVGEPEMDQLLFEAFEGKEMTPEMKKNIAEAVKAILKIQEHAD